MFDYIEGFISKIPSSLKVDSMSADPNPLLKVIDNAPMLQPTDSKIYYHHMMLLLWLSNIRRPDLLPPLSYITTRVQSPNTHDWDKLACT